jgi:hypothetical protein
MQLNQLSKTPYTERKSGYATELLKLHQSPRGFAAQQTEAAVGGVVLNQMLAAGRPDSVRRTRVITQQIGVGVIACSVLHVHQRRPEPAPAPSCPDRLSA